TRLQTGGSGLCPLRRFAAQLVQGGERLRRIEIVGERVERIRAEIAGRRIARRTPSPGQSCSSSWIVTKLPSDFDIFSPSTCRKPLCIQKFAITGVWKAQRDCAISFSWCGKT